MKREKETNNICAKPFLKWAGGKSQLLSTFTEFLPPELSEGKVETYFEPFLGGGAVYFRLAQKFSFKKAYLYDINEELVLAYRTIQKNVEEVISCLERFSNYYYSLSDNKREDCFYAVRKQFNADSSIINYKKYSENWALRTAQLVFLNKTCYNGLFRVNKKGGFNVPFGRYKNPSICDAGNLLKVSKLLKNAIIQKGDFERCKSRVNDKSFVYFDPPYRPISRTSSFTSYSTNDFGDCEQRRLAKLFAELNSKQTKLMLSNSDPKNENRRDNFFEELFICYTINKVPAYRMINCNGKKRGRISELLITNY